MPGRKSARRRRPPRARAVVESNGRRRVGAQLPVGGAACRLDGRASLPPGRLRRRRQPRQCSLARGRGCRASRAQLAETRCASLRPRWRRRAAIQHRAGCVMNAPIAVPAGRCPAARAARIRENLWRYGAPGGGSTRGRRSQPHVGSLLPRSAFPLDEDPNVPPGRCPIRNDEEMRSPRASPRDAGPGREVLLACAVAEPRWSNTSAATPSERIVLANATSGRGAFPKAVGHDGDRCRGAVGHGEVQPCGACFPA